MPCRLDSVHKRSIASRAAIGHIKKAGVEPVAELQEFRTNGDVELNLGDVLTVEKFEAGQKIDVIGTSKGRGFQGVVKRYGFAGGPLLTVRCFTAVVVPTVCANGQAMLSGGKKMPGHMGDVPHSPES